MNEYQEAFNEFESMISEGLTVEAHSGINGQPETVCYTAKEYYEADETAAEEEFSNYLDGESLDQLVSLEDCLNGVNLQHVLEQQCYDSYINGQKAQFVAQFECLEEKTDFLEFLEDDEREREILRYLINH